MRLGGPGYPGRGPVYDLDGHRTADDRAVEALLTSVREPCTAQQLASGLGWTLTRTIECLPNGRQPRAAKAATFARSPISAVREAHRRADAIVTIVRYE